MRTTTLVKRIERAEQAARTQSKFSRDCICFPRNEPPFRGRGDNFLFTAVYMALIDPFRKLIV
jgi:hypothetical protein